MSHLCPDCGAETEGSYSEGGVKWALCERCMERVSKEERREAERQTPLFLRRQAQSAPLGRQHVEHFLRAPDDVYQQKLRHLLDAEIEREEAAERAMRERLDREQRQKEEQERAATERAARAEARHQKPEKLIDPRSATPEPAPVAAAPPAEARSEPEPEAPPVGKARFIVTAHFDISAPAAAPEAAIESKLRALLEKAGITSLVGIEVRRA